MPAPPTSQTVHLCWWRRRFRLPLSPRPFIVSTRSCSSLDQQFRKQGGAVIQSAHRGKRALRREHAILLITGSTVQKERWDRHSACRLSKGASERNGLSSSARDP